MLADAYSLEFALLHQLVKEDLVEDQHVSVLGRDLLHPNNLHLVGDAVILEWHLVEILLVNQRVEAVSVHNLDVQLLLELSPSTSHQLPHDDRVIGDLRCDL